MAAREHPYDPPSSSPVEQPFHVTVVPEVEIGAIARAIGLSKVYGAGDARVVALDDASVAFARGQLTAIMGPSGSGKSTLMHCMAAAGRADLRSCRHRRKWT